jgi:hypothetical protein
MAAFAKSWGRKIREPPRPGEPPDVADDCLKKSCFWEIFVVPNPSTGGSRTACPRCNAQMVEMVRTEPSENEPG